MIQKRSPQGFLSKPLTLGGGNISLSPLNDFDADMVLTMCELTPNDWSPVKATESKLVNQWKQEDIVNIKVPIDSRIKVSPIQILNQEITESLRD